MSVYIKGYNIYMNLYQHTLDVLETRRAQEAGKVYAPDNNRYYSMVSGSPSIHVVDGNKLLSIAFDGLGRVKDASVFDRKKLLIPGADFCMQVQPENYEAFARYVTKVCFDLAEIS